MKRTIASLLLLLLLDFIGFLGGAGAQTVACDITDTVPCKKMRVYNNNPPFIGMTPIYGCKHNSKYQTGIKISSVPGNL